VREWNPEGMSQDLKLRYDRPAEAWHEGLPIGNGRIGAMLVDGRITLNEDGLWSGTGGQPLPDGVDGVADEAAALVRRGQHVAADNLLARLQGKPNTEAYQPAGTLIVTYADHADPSGAAESPHPVEQRELDLRDGVATVVRGRIRQEALVSERFQILALRWTADDAFDLGLAFEWPHEGGASAADFAAQVAYTPWTSVWNLTGWPAISLPLHWSVVDGVTLPIGVMLGGWLGDEETLLSLSAQLETARPWRTRRPAIW
jgi:alpha-L-fucosidase 2